MSVSENSAVDIDLDTFSQELFSTKVQEEVKEEAQVEETAPEDDTLAIEDQDEDIEDTETEAEAPDKPERESEAEVGVEKPKSRFQKRIDELVTKAREAEEREQKLRADMDALIAKLNKEPAPTEDKPKVTTQEGGGPSIDDKDEAGNDRYPLGEFDPAYIRDLTRYTLSKELAEQKAAEAEALRQRELQSAQEALTAEWKDKLEAAKEKYPDLLERNHELADVFKTLEPDYGEYLASAIMSLEYGTDVLYYLGSNAKEAKKIVEMGPARATIALGRIEARFALQDDEKATQKLNVSKAPKPPERLNKGNSVTRSVADDTDDLEAFSKKLFKR